MNLADTLPTDTATEVIFFFQVSSTPPNLKAPLLISTIHPTVAISLTTSALADICITASLVYYMLAAKRGLSDEQGMLFLVPSTKQPAADQTIYPKGILPDKIISLVIFIAWVTNGVTATDGIVSSIHCWFCRALRKAKPLPNATADIANIPPKKASAIIYGAAPTKAYHLITVYPLPKLYVNSCLLSCEFFLPLL